MFSRHSEVFKNSKRYNLLEWLKLVLRSHIVSIFTSLKRSQGTTAMYNVAPCLQAHMSCTWIITRRSQEGRANTCLLVWAWSAMLFVTSQKANLQNCVIQPMQMTCTWNKQKKKIVFFSINDKFYNVTSSICSALKSDYWFPTLVNFRVHVFLRKSSSSNSTAISFKKTMSLAAKRFYLPIVAAALLYCDRLNWWAHLYLKWNIIKASGRSWASKTAMRNAAFSAPKFSLFHLKSPELAFQFLPHSQRQQIINMCFLRDTRSLFWQQAPGGGKRVTTERTDSVLRTLLTKCDLHSTWHWVQR